MSATANSSCQYDANDLAQTIEAWRNVTVLCLGDVMLDRYVYGQVDRISPEAPIPVLRVVRESLMLGGAGNVVRNLAVLGATTVFVSVIGDDDAGPQLGALLGKEVRVEPHLLIQRGRSTTIKTRFIAGSHHLLRTDWETVRPIDQGICHEIQRTAAACLAHCQLVVLSDYGKGVLTPEVVRSVIDAAIAAGKPVIVDPKGNDFARYRGATLITPNRGELVAASRQPCNDLDGIVAAARRLIVDNDFGAMLVTLSEQGMVLVGADGSIDAIPAQAREVFDVSGAGDTVISVLAAALGAGAALPAAMRLANVAAGIVVGKVGTATVHPQELNRALLDQRLMSDTGKVVTVPEAIDQIAKWRLAELRIGFTNGCFDLLHPGHISLLRQARRACDRLIVGLNSDASVRRLNKGPERPVQNEAARATVLSSLAPVDLVVLFDDDTPRELIRALRPDLLVKGADYTIETVVGADLVQGYGGTVLLAELEQGHSTTNLVQRMRNGR
ncbi:MAG: D-glycero-beta-D-manno-heptose-7-phosphate kinase [Acidobacteriaceae bacterium]|nr:D-glycero-beta-D-manno-heptose-7-phosphate kinase [Acidobacteriaceae bacterium]